MKTFIVKADGKTYSVKTNDFRSAVSAVKAVTAKDEASQLDVIQALVTDEQAAIAAYMNAIANLDGKVDPQYIEVLRNILKEENKHVENLQAIITGNVTEKNVEDSVKDGMTYRGYKIEEERGLGWSHVLVYVPEVRSGPFVVSDIDSAKKYIDAYLNGDKAVFKDSVKDVDFAYAADLADEVASLLRRNKLEQAKRVLQKLVAAMA